MDGEKFVFDETQVLHPFTENTEYDVLFSSQRLSYLKSIENFIVKAFHTKKLSFEINYNDCSMKVATTKATRDPYIILKGRDLIKLLSLGVTLEKACQVLEDNVFSEIIPIRMIVANENTFERRRERLLNPKILNSLQLLTKTYILIANKNACIIGGYSGVEEAKNIIITSFQNTHPAFLLKELIIKRKLKKDNIEDDWNRFLPNIKKSHSKPKIAIKSKKPKSDEVSEGSENLGVKEKNLNEHRKKRDFERFIEPDE